MIKVIVKVKNDKDLKMEKVCCMLRCLPAVFLIDKKCLDLCLYFILNKKSSTTVKMLHLVLILLAYMVGFVREIKQLIRGNYGTKTICSYIDLLVGEGCC
jgi:hypothetical protein